VKYASLGGPSGFLGAPITPELTCPDGIGAYQHYQNNASIYWSPATGAHEIHGRIRYKWASMGWEQSPYGYPTSDEGNTTHPGDRCEYFQNGEIVWEPGPFFFGSSDGPTILTIFKLSSTSVRFTWDLPHWCDGVHFRWGLAGNAAGEAAFDLDGGSGGSFDAPGVYSTFTYTFSVDPFNHLTWPYPDICWGFTDPLIYTMT
jgi:hypothetical protein